MAPRVQKTEVFRKGWNIASQTYFASWILRKHYFLLWMKEKSIFSLFLPWNYFLQCWAIWLCSQLYILVLHLYIFKHKHKSNIKGAIFILKSSHLFRDQPYKEVLEVKCQACNFTGVLLFTSVFEDFNHIFPTCFFHRTSHNLICNKFAILKNKKLTKIFEIRKF